LPGEDKEDMNNESFKQRGGTGFPKRGKKGRSEGSHAKKNIAGRKKKSQIDSKEANRAVQKKKDGLEESGRVKPRKKKSGERRPEKFGKKSK